jgi:4-hydroxy-tetrahydrodipicolinate synthase
MSSTFKPAGGIVPPIVTPLSGRDTLDVDGLECLLEHLVAGGVHGIFVLGTTGEGPSLGHRLQREMVETTARLLDGRLPLYVCITDTAFAESVILSEAAADAGASALVLATPYYFPAGQRELTDYIEHLVPELPLPLMLYNMPTLTKVWFEIDTLRRLTDHENIIGVKDSSGDLDYYGKLLGLKDERPDWSFFMGPEHLMMESVRMGGDGGVNGGANIFPELFVNAFDAARNEDAEISDSLQKEIDALQEIYDIGKYASRHIKATKCALSLLDICDDFMAEPFHRFKAPERARVEAILNKLKHSSSHPIHS